MTPFNKANWYWIVGDDQTQVYSSAIKATVPADEAGYLAWLDDGNIPSTIPSLEDLTAVLREQRPKSTVMARCFAMGFTDQLKALFDGNFALAQQWNTPDWPNVYVDDEGMLQALRFVGMTEEQIATAVA